MSYVPKYVSMWRLWQIKCWKWFFRQGHERCYRHNQHCTKTSSWKFWYMTFNPIYHVRCWSSTPWLHFSFYIDIITPTWQKTKWQFTFKYIQSQKSFGFTFYYWKLSNFWILKNLIHDFFWFCSKFSRAYVKDEWRKKRETDCEIWTHTPLD